MPVAYHYSIRRSKRAKRIILRINNVGAVEVVVPWYVAFKHGEKFLQQRLEWINNIRARIAKQREQMPVKQVDEGQARRQAQEYFENVIGEMARQLGVVRARVKIADFRTQWGSCNRRTHTLKFSWRLMLASSHVARYVAAHEVAHLVQPNHSKSFWYLVAQLDPEYDEARRWLRRHGRALRV